MKRYLVLILAMVFALAGVMAGCALTPELATYSNYGFSFQYPENYTVVERDANESSGTIRVGVENDKADFFNVWYVKTGPQWNIEGALEHRFSSMEEVEWVESLYRGELVETTKAGHRMVYQYYTVTHPAGKDYGVVGAFYCDKSGKGFELATLTNTVNSEEEALEHFQRYIDSFVCH